VKGHESMAVGDAGGVRSSWTCTRAEDQGTQRLEEG